MEELREGWKRFKLGEIIELIGGGTPKTSVSEYWNGKIPWLSVKDFGSVNKFVEVTEKTITELGLKESSTKILKKNDIIISARGTVGALAVLKREMAFNQSCYGIRGKSVVNNDFLYYLLKNTIEELKQNAYGSVFDTITTKTFDSIEIDLPPLEEQERIAEILSSLDDKIELNNQMNKTLEETAQALFKEWFVDFNFPNENGEPYRDSGGEMEESELGMIPKGWRVGKLGELVDIKTGKQNANIAKENGKFRFYTCSQNFTYTDNYSFDTSAILLAGNGDFNVKWYTGKFEAYQRTYVLIPSEICLISSIYYFINSFLSELSKNSQGSVIKFITKPMISDYKMVIPEIGNFIKLSSFFTSINNQIDNNDEQNSNLNNQREVIIKELLKGEV